MTSPINKSHGFQEDAPEYKADDASTLTEHQSSSLPEASAEPDETMEILNATRRELDYGDTITQLEGLLAQEIPAAVKKLTPKEREELRKLLPTLAKPTGNDKWHISSQRSQIGYALRDLAFNDKKHSERLEKFEQIKARATNASRTFQAGISNSILGQKLGSLGQKIKEGVRSLPAVVGGLFAKASNALFSSKTIEPRRDSGYEEVTKASSKISHSQIEDSAVEDKSSEVYSGISQTQNDDQETSSDTTELEMPSTRTRLPPLIINNSVKDLRDLNKETLTAYAKHQNPEKANFINFLVESKGESLDTIKKLSTIWLEEQQSALINDAKDEAQMLQALEKVWSSLGK